MEGLRSLNIEKKRLFFWVYMFGEIIDFIKSESERSEEIWS